MRLVARVEGESRLLRAAASHSTAFRTRGRVAVADRVQELPGVPFSIPIDAEARTDLPALRADIVRLGVGRGILRARAFYLEAGITVAVQGRLTIPWPKPASLHRGAVVVERIRRLGVFRVPLPLERGRGLRHAWLVEELVPGRPIPADEWAVHAPQVLAGLARLWIGAGVSRRPLERVLSPARARAALLAASSERDIDHAMLAERVQRLFAGGGDILTGWCHGDPIHANFLRVDGGFVLLDWEAAGYRPLGWDGSKVVSTLDDPLAVGASIADTMKAVGGPASLPWVEQMAVGCMVRLARSRRRLAVARLTGNRPYEEHVLAARRANATVLARLVVVAEGGRTAVGHTVDVADETWSRLRETVLRYAEYGAKAEFIAQPDACPVCLALGGRMFDPADAPRIPVERCTNAFCRCDYRPKL
jgi:hypothetical protein